MRKKVNSFLAAVTITYAMLFSCRVVFIPTPLNVAEQFFLVCAMIEYTYNKSKALGEKDEDTK